MAGYEGAKSFWMGGGNSCLIERGAILNKMRIDITGHNNKLVIRSGVNFAEGGRIRIEDDGNVVEVGENTTLINCFLSSADRNTSLIIGKNCLFSSDVIIRTSDAHSIINNTGERVNQGVDVVIGDHVWICNGVKIMKGTRIGSDSIIGSNAMLTGQLVESNCLAVGSPCKIVKTGVKWSKTRI